MLISAKCYYVSNIALNFHRIFSHLTVAHSLSTAVADKHYCFACTCYDDDDADLHSNASLHIGNSKTHRTYENKLSRIIYLPLSYILTSLHISFVLSAHATELKYITFISLVHFMMNTFELRGAFVFHLNAANHKLKKSKNGKSSFWYFYFRLLLHHHRFICCKSVAFFPIFKLNSLLF